MTLTSTQFRLEVDVAPAKVGPNTIHLYAFQADGNGPRTVVEWKGTAALPSQGIEPVTIPLLAFTPEHATGQIDLPTTGTWEMRFTVRVDEINQASVTAKVPIR